MSSVYATPRAAFLNGMRDTLPMVVGATPFGLIFGAFAITQAQLSISGTMGFSLFVFAGSSQFIAATLLAQSASIGIIVLTTFIVNIRHALYGASLAPYMKHLTQRWLLPLAFWLTDETYATVINKWAENSPNEGHMRWYHLGSSLLMYINWNFWTLIGALFGSQVEGAENWGLDFAMVVTFIGIVVPMLITRPMIVCAMVAAIVSILTHDLPNNLGLIVASMTAIAAAYFAETLNMTQRRAEIRAQLAEGENA
ncbi:MAG: branched-chain amino acid ABC transporter permease [Phototrophicales bacterium]|nr:MAG: branched-chain amino acid ABC transporter permease [Phototrophicales bacterium]